MIADKERPEMASHEAIGEFWDAHSLADQWKQMEAAEFDLEPDVRRRYLIAVDPQLLQRAQQLAGKRGLSTESLVNLLLEQRTNQLEVESG